MATKRLANCALRASSQLSSRTPAQALIRTATTRRPSQTPIVRPAAILPTSQVRWNSSDSNNSEPPTGENKMWNFEQIQRLTRIIEAMQRDRQVYLVDTREPGELAATGRIPGAVNIPIKSSPDGLHLPADEFEERFGFPRPTYENELVFYCVTGVRSRAAAALARKAGWKRVGEYRGSWKDWSSKGGAVEK